MKKFNYSPIMPQIQQQSESSKSNSSKIKKPNILLIQLTMMQSRCFPVDYIQEAIEQMITLYGESLISENSQYSDPDQNHITQFSVDKLIKFYQNMENVMYMEKKRFSHVQDKHKTTIESYDKQYVLDKLQEYCLKKCEEMSVQLAYQAYQQGLTIQGILKKLGFHDSSYQTII